MKKNKLKFVVNRFFTWAAPKQCIICNKNLSLNYPTCDDCYFKLPFEISGCSRCGQPFAANLDHCGNCIANPPIYDKCFCAFQYSHPIDEKIRQFKYSERPELASDLAKLLVREINNNQLERPELLIPVPIHINKLRNRGFNQALELTKYLSSSLKIPYKTGIIVKHQATAPQVQQTLSQRKRNIRGCFSYKKNITAKHVAIIDDVITTGATVAEITKILKRNGVNYIQIWGVAHTK